MIPVLHPVVLYYKCTSKRSTLKFRDHALGLIITALVADQEPVVCDDPSAVWHRHNPAFLT